MATQKTVVEVDIQGTEKVESMRSQMRKLREELARLPEGTAEFKKVQRQLGELTDKMGDLSKSVNTLSGDPLERLNNSFGMIGSSLLSLDFGAAITGLDGVSSAVKDLKWADITKGVNGLGTSFINLGKALFNNPIFLIGSVIAAVGVALYEYGQTIPFVSDETKKFAQETHKAADASEKALKAFDLEERKLRALGAAEEDIIKIRRQKTKETLKASREELMAEQKRLEEIQKSYEDSKKRVAQSAIGGGTFTLVQAGLEKLGNAFGLVASKEQVADQTKNIDELKTKIKEYEVTILELDKKEKDIHEKKVKQQEKEAAKNREQLTTEVANVTSKEAQKLTVAEQAGLDLNKISEQLARSRAATEIKVEEEKRQAILEGEKAFQKAKLSIVSDSISILENLNSALVDSGLINAKKGFQIAKTLGIAQATIATIEATQNAFKTAQASPITTVFPAYPFIQAGVAASAGLARIAAIKAQQFNGGGGSQPSTSMGGGGGSISTPSAPAVDLSYLNKGSNKAQPVQAYVLATNVSSAQEAEQKIKDQSKIIK
jgi:DNA repair exonuclease SbcCD ATPase subunit